MFTAEGLSHLLLQLYEAASSPERIPSFLQALTEAVDAKAAVIREHTFRSEAGVQVETTTLFESAGYSIESLESYSSYYSAFDPFLLRCLERFPHAESGVSQILFPHSEYRETEFHSDWGRKHDIGRVMWAKLSSDSGFHASLSIVRSDQAAHFDSTELEVIAAIAPHLRQAFHLARSLQELKSSNAMLQQGLDEMEIAISMARHDGSILRSTPGAERVFEARDGIWLHKGRLRAAQHAEQKTLDALIRGACETSAAPDLSPLSRVRLAAAGSHTVRSWTAPSGGAMLVTRKASQRPLQVVVSPFRPGTLLHGTPLHEAQAAAALVQFSDPAATPRSRAAILKTLYGLTPTESRLADLLLQGFEVREIADRMRITLETARFNLKRVLAKTGTRRQAELVRLMLSLPGN